MRKELSITFITLILSIYCGVKHIASAQPPNIVVIIADDLGWNDVGFHGANEIPTPNIDALAYNGVILNRHYSLPICTPSRTAFLTGKYPIRTGMQGYPLRGAEVRAVPLNNTLLPEYLRRLGYATHLVGKWHVGYYTRNHGPARRGFDTFFGYYSGYLGYFDHKLFESGQTGYDLHRIVGDDHTIVYNNEYMTDVITEEAEDIISSHNPRKPLFLQVAHLAPHASNALEVRNWKETNDTFGYIKDVNRRTYAGVVATLDESVGRIVDALRKKNMLQNSIIIFMSDNGAPTEGPLQNFGSNYPLRGLKLTLFEGAVRVAACIYSPLIDSPSRVSMQLFHITDWLPTLYSAAGGDSNDLEPMDGIDQWLAIKGAKKSKRRIAFIVNIDEKLKSEAVLVGKYKLLKDTSMYKKYYGSKGDNTFYDIISVLESPAASAIANISTSVLNRNKIMNLRKKATVVCRKLKKLKKLFPKCKKRFCLFNVYEDPCETTDLSLKYPKAVKELNMFLDYYKSVLMKQKEVFIDPDGFPRNFNNTWMPWLPDDYDSRSVSSTAITSSILDRNCRTSALS